MSFPVTNQTGSGMSTIDPLYMSTFAIDIEFPKVLTAKGDETDTQDCQSTVYAADPATRTASGPMAGLITTEILDKLAYWDIRLQLCNQGMSSILLHSEIDALNLAFGCFGLPASAVQRGSDGYPHLTSFTATQCNATIYDVAVNRVLMAQGFDVVYEVDGDVP